MIVNVYSESKTNEKINTLNLEESASSEIRRIKNLLDESNLEYVSSNIKNILGITKPNNANCFMPRDIRITTDDFYRVILYIRLSVEDGDVIDGDVSKSIRNQLLILLDECKKRNWVVVAIFCEEGISGADDNRTEWKKSLKYCECRRTQIVLCKSQSRFSRSMEMIEKYLHKEFANWNIRFVGLVDSTDTSVKGNKKTRQINGLVNEWQVEDQSINTRAILRSKKSNGLFASAFAPYGYKKDPEDKYHLIVDEEAAKVVRMIFDKYSKGEGYYKIKSELNRMRIPCPSEYKRLHSSKYRCWTVDYNKVIDYKIEKDDTIQSVADEYCSSIKDILEKNNMKSEDEFKIGEIIKIPTRPIWSMASVRHILMDEVYIGTLVQGKVEGRSYKDKTQVKIPKDQWIRVPHCHTPIIEKEVWDNVSERFRGNERIKPDKNGEIYIFSKKVYCSCCGKRFAKSLGNIASGKREYLKCIECRETGGQLCSNNRAVRRDELEKIILNKINEQIKKYYDLSEVEKNYYEQKNNSNIEKDLKSLIEEKNRIEKTINKKVDMLSLLYEDRANGVISSNEFSLIKNKNNTDIEDLKERIVSIDNEVIELERKKEVKKNKEKLFKKYTKIEKLDRVILDEFISKIYVGKLDTKENSRTIQIEWNINEY